MQTAATKATPHKHDCQMAFGRKDPSCPRCQELLAGASPRQAPWFKRAAEQRQQTINGIHAHFNSHKHMSGGCGPVCTYGDP